MCKQTNYKNNIIEISNLSSPELDVFARLTDAQLKGMREGLFIAESTNVISLALDKGCIPISILTERKHIDGKAADIINRCGDIPVFTAEREVISSLTGYELTRGVLCAMHRPQMRCARDLCLNATRVAILDSVADTTNIGAIFRSAAALGIDAILLSPKCGDPLSRRAVRVSMGNVLNLPWAYIESGWPHDFLEQIHGDGFASAAMALSSRAVPIDDGRLMAEEKLAIIFGSEGKGLSEDVINACTYTAIIPMQMGVDSLNVAAACAVAFWQLRQH